jgi:putative RNA 2'-phosphotransferase
MNPVHLSKFMSLVLRHRAHDFGLTLDAEGFVALKDLESIVRERMGASLDDILSVVANSQPQRFEIRGEMIRATYGHSRNRVDQVTYPSVEPPEILYHGTNARALESIQRNGLRAMQRQYVHLSTTVERAMQVATRRTQAPVLLTIHAHDAHAAGTVFHSPEAKHFLAKEISVEYIEFPKE